MWICGGVYYVPKIIGKKSWFELGRIVGVAVPMWGELVARRSCTDLSPSFRRSREQISKIVNSRDIALFGPPSGLLDADRIAGCTCGTTPCGRHEGSSPRHLAPENGKFLPGRVRSGPRSHDVRRPGPPQAVRCFTRPGPERSAVGSEAARRSRTALRRRLRGPRCACRR